MALDLTRVSDLTLETALTFIKDDAGDDPLYHLMRQLTYRIADARQEQEEFRVWCRRADVLYYAERYTSGGADLWPDDPSATTAGMTHVSVNTPQVYVDVPSALQAYPPIENMLATKDSPEARSAASALERLMVAWKVAEDYDLKFHKACTLKALYGRTAGKVYWDKDEEDGNGRACVEIVEQPQNLWLGYQNDSYEEVEWAAYVQKLTPNAVMEEFGVDVTVRVVDGKTVPFVSPDPVVLRPTRPFLNYQRSMIEVWDYWYRLPKYNKKGKFLRMETWNVVFAGSVAVQGPTAYPEYEGDIPFLPLYNSFLPGVPNGRPELRDMEPLIREMQERITNGAQMIASGTGGDFWQLTGMDAPSRVPDNLKPVRNKVVAPGPGNRIETISPFIAEFQLEQFLGRLDRLHAVVSGLNDLLLGLAPSAVLNSSKAINALIANYETRISMPRLLLYTWRRNVWNMVVKIWAKKDKTVAQLLLDGGGTLDIVDPSLSPRDEAETAVKAANLVNAKLWSQRRGMDAVGVDDPETEQNMIREERTDATLFPESVETMAQLMSVLQTLNLNANAATQGQAQGQLASGQNALRTALGGATPQTGPGAPGAGGEPSMMGQTPPITGAPQAAGGPSATPFARGPSAPNQGEAKLQTMIQRGTSTGRILTQRNLGRGR